LPIGTPNKKFKKGSAPNSSHVNPIFLIEHYLPVLGIWIRIRICWIRMFLSLQDPDPLVRCADPDPALNSSSF
jgi:hypothetical protein